MRRRTPIDAGVSDPGTAEPASDRDGLVVWRATGGMDAIDDYSRRLVHALRARGVGVRYARNGLGAARAHEANLRWVLIQYNPFRYGRWGFAPRLVRDAARLRRGGVPVAVMVHEAWVPIADWRTLAMGAWQRAQLRALLAVAASVLASTEALAKELGGNALHVPVASNITPTRTTPELARAELGLPEGLVVSTFGRRHESRALDFATAAVKGVAASRGGRTTVLNLGADAPPLDLPPQFDVRNIGPLSERELSLHLWASDLVLLPFKDGVSTRRSTLMAALAHGRPVVGTHGRNTDPILAEHSDSLVLAPVSDLDAYVAAAVLLAADDSRRRAIADAARRLYEHHFDWPHVAAGTLSALDRISSSSRSSPEVSA